MGKPLGALETKVHSMTLFTLTVELKVPIETEPLIGAPALTFSHWLPIGKSNGISVTEDGLKLLLWFDLQSTWWASQPTEEELKNHVNVLAHYVRAEIMVEGVGSDLAKYMQTRDFKRSPNESERATQNEYEQLGARILRVLLKRTNRIIAYARAIKGQYWLLEYGTDMGRLHSYFQTFEARGQIDSGKPFRFQPGVGDTLHIAMTPEDKFITESEWSEVSKFVTSEQRPPLVFELLAGAEQLAGNSYARSALTEAVTALEVAISDFGRLQSHNSKLSSLFGPRLGVDRLQKQIEHMGLSGTISYLLPLILPDAVLSAEILSGCRDAITARQNVVHNGQREVPGLHRYISSIKACCKILREYSDETTTRE
jgi:hypothetical protein